MKLIQTYRTNADTEAQFTNRVYYDEQHNISLITMKPLFPSPERQPMHMYSAYNSLTPPGETTCN